MIWFSASCTCNSLPNRLKIPRCAGRKFPTPEPHEWASLASDRVEPSAVFWRSLGVTESEAKERAAASAPSCPRALAAVLQPIALAANVDGRRVMQQPVQDRCGDDGITEDRSPLPVAFVGGQDDAPAFVPRTHQHGRKSWLPDRPAADSPLHRSPKLSAPGTRASGDPTALRDTRAPSPLPDRAR